MPVTKVSFVDTSKLVGIQVPSTLFKMAVDESMDNVYAFRNQAPMFALHGDSVVEVFEEAEAIISRFLNKMHSYGFRM